MAKPKMRQFDPNAPIEFTTRKTKWSAKELMATEFPPVRFVIPMIGPEGLMILAGAPKLGKSWLVMDLSVNVSTGGFAIGKLECEEGDVLHLALEDNPRRLKSRLEMMGVTVNDRLTFETEWPTIDDDTFFDRLEEWRTSVKSPRVITIDTMVRIRPSKQGHTTQTAYSEDTQFLAPLQAYAMKHRLLIIVVHHTKKEKDEDWVKELSGSLGLSGVADTLSLLSRERGQDNGILRGTGRDITEYEKVATFDGSRGLWTLTDVEPIKLLTTPERGLILQYLRENGESGTGEIAQGTGKTTTNVSNMLGKLQGEGLVVKKSYGRWDLLFSASDGTGVKVM